MKTLLETVKDAARRQVAVGHFNISDLAGLKAIFEAAQELNLPVVIGVSEGEREFVGVRQAAALVKCLREEYSAGDGGYPIFLNADHTYSLDKIKEAVAAGFDMVIFDGAKLPFEENIAKTKEVVEYARAANPKIIVEGEIGYIGVSSAVFKELPAGAKVEEKDLPTTEQAAEFVKRTGIDFLAPAVGNVHGMFANAPNPRLHIDRIKEIKMAVGVPLVLHGGSGIVDEDFTAAIKAGISIIHINTEIRRAWRRGVEDGLRKNPEEVAPYKILPPAVEAIKKIVKERLTLFSGG